MKRRNKTVILEDILVEDYAAGGKAIGRVDGKIIFIENAVPGDRVDVRLQKNKKDWAEGTPVRVHALSPERVIPFCPHFGICGGCQWQMLPYEKQLFYKQREVEETLKRIGKVSLPAIEPILGANETIYYRNKIEYTFSNREFSVIAPPVMTTEERKTFKPGATVAGFHAKGFFDKIVDIQSCYLQAEPTNAIRLAIKEFGRKKDWSFYDARNHAGFLRNVQVRLCRSGEIMVNVIVGEEDGEKIEALMDHLLKQFPSLTTLLYTINRKWNDSLQDLVPRIYHGKGYVMEELKDSEGNAFQFKIGPTSFFQTNTSQAEQLYRVIRDFAELTGEQTVYDLYCGTGSIGIFLSRNAGRIVGVEMVAAAVEDAKENATINNLSNCAFFQGDVAEVCRDDFFSVNGRPDVIITDPPRTGMHEKLLKSILDADAPLVVYVSCNPATQARDLNGLDAKYEVTRIRPLDMFPHTHHIENVAQLRLKKDL